MDEKEDEQQDGQKEQRGGRRFVVALMLAAIAWSLYVVVTNVLFPPNPEEWLQPPALKVQDLGAIDLNWRVQQLDGPAMDMDSVKGKVVVLNFWEHWCPPCQDEMPGLQRLYKAVKGDGILVMPVFQDDAKATRRFLQRANITMPVYQVQGPLPADVAPLSFPTTYIIDRDGRAVYRQDSAALWDDPSVVEFLKGLGKK